MKKFVVTLFCACIFLGGCQSKQSADRSPKETSAVSEKVEASEVPQAAEIQATEVPVIENMVQTEELPIKKALKKVKEVSYGVPAYASMFFVSKDEDVIAVDNNTLGEDKFEFYQLTSQGFKSQDPDEGYYYFQYPIAYTSCAGKLYAKHVSGVFVLDEQKKQWRQIVEGSENFQMGSTYSNTFEVVDDKYIYLMGYRGDDECATDFCKYTIE